MYPRYIEVSNKVTNETVSAADKTTTVLVNHSIGVQNVEYDSLSSYKLTQFYEISNSLQSGNPSKRLQGALLLRDLLTDQQTAYYCVQDVNTIFADSHFSQQNFTNAADAAAAAAAAQSSEPTAASRTQANFNVSRIGSYRSRLDDYEPNGEPVSEALASTSMSLASASASVSLSRPPTTKTTTSLAATGGTSGIGTIGEAGMSGTLSGTEMNLTNDTILATSVPLSAIPQPIPLPVKILPPTVVHPEPIHTLTSTPTSPYKGHSTGNTSYTLVHDLLENLNDYQQVVCICVSECLYAILQSSANISIAFDKDIIYQMYVVMSRHTDAMVRYWFFCILLHIYTVDTKYYSKLSTRRYMELLLENLSKETNMYIKSMILSVVYNIFTCTFLDACYTVEGASSSRSTHYPLEKSIYMQVLDVCEGIGKELQQNMQDYCTSYASIFSNTTTSTNNTKALQLHHHASVIDTIRAQTKCTSLPTMYLSTIPQTKHMQMITEYITQYTSTHRNDLDTIFPMSLQAIMLYTSCVNIMSVCSQYNLELCTHVYNTYTCLESMFELMTNVSIPYATMMYDTVVKCIMYISRIPACRYKILHDTSKLTACIDVLLRTYELMSKKHQQQQPSQPSQQSQEAKSSTNTTSTTPLLLSIHGVAYLLQLLSNLAEMPLTKEPEYVEQLEAPHVETALLFFRDVYPKKSINVFAKNTLEQIYWRP